MSKEIESLFNIIRQNNEKKKEVENLAWNTVEFVKHYVKLNEVAVQLLSSIADNQPAEVIGEHLDELAVLANEGKMRIERTIIALKPFVDIGSDFDDEKSS